MIEALRELVRVSMRTDTRTAPAVQTLILSLARASDWAPHALDAALAVIEASVAPAGSAWPLTRELVPAYGFALPRIATLAADRPADGLPLVGALANWGEDDSEVGRALREV